MNEMKNCEHRRMLDYEEQYLIAEDGNVWSIRSKKYLYLNDNGNGYLQFYACKPGQKKVPKLVHKVVAETYYRRVRVDVDGKPLEEVNHIDRDTHNNSVDNLQILTIKDHRHFHTGKNNGNTGKKMSDERKAKIRATRQARKALDPNYGKRKKESSSNI